jgi:hypothetical protein
MACACVYDEDATMGAGHAGSRLRSGERWGEDGCAGRGDAGTSQPRKRRVSEGITSQVRAATIIALNRRVRTGSGHAAMVGPSTARISVITA